MRRFADTRGGMLIRSRWYPRRVSTPPSQWYNDQSRPSRPLHPEDIVNLDLTLFHRGFHCDTSATFLLPDVDKQGRDLVKATGEALEVGIQACGPGKALRDIGLAIE